VIDFEVTEKWPTDSVQELYKNGCKIKGIYINDIGKGYGQKRTISMQV
jgi:hypothetical protein